MYFNRKVPRKKLKPIFEQIRSYITSLIFSNFRSIQNKRSRSDEIFYNAYSTNAIFLVQFSVYSSFTRYKIARRKVLVVVKDNFVEGVICKLAN